MPLDASSSWLLSVRARRCLCTEVPYALHALRSCVHSRGHPGGAAHRREVGQGSSRLWLPVRKAEVQADRRQGHAEAPRHGFLHQRAVLLQRNPRRLACAEGQAAEGQCPPGLLSGRHEPRREDALGRLRRAERAGEGRDAGEAQAAVRSRVGQVRLGQEAVFGQQGRAAAEDRGDLRRNPEGLREVRVPRPVLRAVPEQPANAPDQEVTVFHRQAVPLANKRASGTQAL